MPHFTAIIAFPKGLCKVFQFILPEVVLKSSKDATSSVPAGPRQRTGSRNLAIVHLRKASRAGEEAQSSLPQPVFTSFILNQMASPYVFSQHEHFEFEIILIIRGRYRCKLNGEEMVLGANSVLLVQPGDWHEDYCRPPLEYAGLRFNLRSANAAANKLRFFKDSVPPSAQHTRLRSQKYLPLLGEIAKEAEIHDMVSSHIQDALMNRLFWLLVRAYSPELLASWLVPENPDRQFHDRLLRCFAQSVNRSPTVPELARALGVSPRTLSQRCGELLGVSPARAFLHFKADQAHQMLARTEMSVKEVAYRFGFANPYHFSRVYKQMLGHAPSEDKARELA